jgi:hypothetical protein
MKVTIEELIHSQIKELAQRFSSEITESGGLINEVKS